MREPGSQFQSTFPHEQEEFFLVTYLLIHSLHVFASIVFMVVWSFSRHSGVHAEENHADKVLGSYEEISVSQ